MATGALYCGVMPCKTTQHVNHESDQDDASIRVVECRAGQDILESEHQNQMDHGMGTETKNWKGKR